MDISDDFVTLHTDRLTLIPCTLEITNAAIERSAALETLVAADVPAEWPGEDLRDFLPLYAKLLKSGSCSLAWGARLIVHNAECTIIGDIGFKGEPDDGGMVEIGYSILPSYRGHGFAAEAARAMIDRAFLQGARVVTAECERDNDASIRVLEKLGMERIDGGDMLYWRTPTSQGTETL